MQVKVFYEETEMNEWLDKNKSFHFDVEDIKFAITPSGQHNFMVMYSGKEQ